MRLHFKQPINFNMHQSLVVSMVLSTVILFVTLVTRASPWKPITAGQDQGTYLSIGHQYASQGTLNYTDYFRKSLTTEQKALYDGNIYNLMPSITLSDTANSIFEMRFYPMHPIWFAVFETFFGQDNAVYSLTFFSLISILALSLLAYEISGRKKLPAYLTAVILSVNPLHTFFSKFPVGEITAVAFTSLAFYFLVKYLSRIKTKENKTLDLILSLVFFTCFFYTRMSSVMYVPIFFIFAAFSTLYIQEQNAKRNILIYFGLLIASFCVSYLFYYFMQPSLFHLIYKSTVQKIFRYNSDIIMATLIVTSSLLVLLLYKIRNHKVVAWLKNTIENNLKTIVFVVLTTAVYIVFIKFLSIQLNPMSQEQINVRYWYIGNNWIQKLKYLNLYVIIQYLTPVGFVLSFIAGFKYLDNIKQNILKAFLFVFVVYFLFINSAFGGLVRYPYYFTRYLFSESIVYMLVLVGIYLGILLEKPRTKNLGIFLFLSIILCSLPPTLFQLNGPEGPHMDFYKEITSKITKNDLVLSATGHSADRPQKYIDNFTTWSIAPLKFYYDYNIFVLPELSDAYSEPIKELAKRYEKIYLLSDKKLAPYYGPNLIPSKLRYSYYNVSEECSLHTYSFLPLESVKTMKIPKFLECLTPPNNYYTRYSNLYMYDVTEELKTKTWNPITQTIDPAIK